MPRGLLIALLVTGLIALGSAAMLVVSLSSSKPGPTTTETNGPDPATPDQGLEGIRFPAFALIDQSGRPVDETVLDGKVTIVDFVFSNCPSICPAMTYRMSKLQERLGDVEGVRFLSVSIDPERDTPERLRAWAAEFDADLETWSFLTGERAVARGIAKAIGFGVEDTGQEIPTSEGGTMSNIEHPTQMVLVGPDRQVLGLYPFAIPERVDALAERARALASELP
ncbi:MAG: SCO family protein [Phycisphaerales bacterium JB037]